MDGRLKMTDKLAEVHALDARLVRIMRDPLSYIHPRRLQLPRSLDTPRQRAVVNQMLLDSLPHGLAALPTQGSQQQRQLLQHWQHLPYVCMLVGAQLLKQDLAWRGRLLQLSAPVRFFMALPLPQMMTAPSSSGIGVSDAASDLPGQVQGVGLALLLDWQHGTPAALLCRMRLLFPAELEAHFENSRRQLQAVELLLISQAIQYAKNYPNPI